MCRGSCSIRQYCISAVRKSRGTPGTSIALAFCTSIICSLRSRHGGAACKLANRDSLFNLLERQPCRRCLRCCCRRRWQNRRQRPVPDVPRNMRRPDLGWCLFCTSYKMSSYRLEFLLAIPKIARCLYELRDHLAERNIALASSTNALREGLARKDL